MNWEVEQIHTGLIEREFFVSKKILTQIAIQKTNIPENAMDVEFELSLHDSNGFGDDNGNTIVMYVFWNEPIPVDVQCEDHLGKLQTKEWNEVKVYHSVQNYEKLIADEKLQKHRGEKIDTILK